MFKCFIEGGECQEQETRWQSKVNNFFRKTSNSFDCLLRKMAILPEVMEEKSPPPLVSCSSLFPSSPRVCLCLRQPLPLQFTNHCRRVHCNFIHPTIFSVCSQRPSYLSCLILKRKSSWSSWFWGTTSNALITVNQLQWLKDQDQETSFPLFKKYSSLRSSLVDWFEDSMNPLKLLISEYG